MQHPTKLLLEVREAFCQMMLLITLFPLLSSCE